MHSLQHDNNFTGTQSTYYTHQLDFEEAFLCLHNDMLFKSYFTLFIIKQREYSGLRPDMQFKINFICHTRIHTEFQLIHLIHYYYFFCKGNIPVLINHNAHCSRLLLMFDNNYPHDCVSQTRNPQNTRLIQVSSVKNRIVTWFQQFKTPRSKFPYYWAAIKSICLMSSAVINIRLSTFEKCFLNLHI